MNIQAELSYGENVNGEFVKGHISPPENNLGSWTTELRKNGKCVGNLYCESLEECKSMAEGFVNIGKYTELLIKISKVKNVQFHNKAATIESLEKEIDEALEQTKT